MLVHYLDVGGVQPPEAAGVESVLAGLRDAIAGDDDHCCAAAGVFDGLYQAFEKEPQACTTRPAPPARSASGEAFRFWLKLGFISFGGPAGQIAIMHQELVERRRWISRAALPARAQLLHGAARPGGAAARHLHRLADAPHAGAASSAGALFVLPSLFILIALSWVYIAFGDLPLVAGLFYGIKPAVTAIVVHAAHRIGSRALKNDLAVGDRRGGLRGDLRASMCRSRPSCWPRR